jgi:predicted aconitase with swiveling domain
VGIVVRPVIATRVLVAGEARGEVLSLAQPLSFWGGLDPATGRIIDVHHPQRDEVVTGRILVMPSGRGSSSSSSVLAEAIRARTAPAGVILADADPIVALGAIVAEELYAITMPILEVADAAGYADIARGQRVRIRNDTIEEA